MFFFRSIFTRNKKKLSSTRDVFYKVRKNTSKTKKFDYKELEKILYEADLGYDLVAELTSELKNIKDLEQGIAFLNQKLRKLLLPYEGKLNFDNKPTVIMLVGVNGTGKTTTAAKLAKMLQDNGKKVMLAAADTFRAAAVDQLEYWSKEINCDFFSKPATSPASLATSPPDNMMSTTRSNSLFVPSTRSRGDLTSFFPPVQSRSKIPKSK